MGQPLRLSYRLLHLCVLTSFSIAQPLFDVLARDPEFFVARRSQPIDLLLLVLFLSIGLPLTLLLVEGAGTVLVGRQWIHGLVVAALAASMVLQLIKRFPFADASLIPWFGPVAGIVFALAYTRFGLLRTYLTWATPAVLIFPALFLWNPQIQKLLTTKQVFAAAEVDIGAPAPLVMIVLDELPLVSLLEENSGIDRVRYPNFAALADDSHWFRNATTVSDFTQFAVPAILTGRYPDPAQPKLPILSDHPDNLFTLMGNSYRLQVMENLTELSGPTRPRTKLAVRFRLLVADLSVVYAHLVLPRHLSTRLPAVTLSWGEFWSGPPTVPDTTRTASDFLGNMGKRASTFRRFIGSLDSGSQPALSFLHSMLPHAPWNYLASGRQYALQQPSEVRGVMDRDSQGRQHRWVEDEWLVIQGYQRHLLQTGFVDRLLGELVSRLKEKGLYEPALIVLTADHGASFRPGDSFRAVTETNYPDILSVPLMIKTPHQKEGSVSDQNVETIDILPTIAAILQLELPWDTDGRSVLDHSLPERTHKKVFSGDGTHFQFPGKLEGREESLRKKLAWFGSEDNNHLFRIGPHAGLLGKNTRGLMTPPSRELKGQLDGKLFFDHVDFSRDFLLANLRGHIFPPRRLDLAVAVNQVIQGVTRTDRDGSGEFAVLVPENAFQEGSNTVDLFEILPTGPEPRLRPIPRPGDTRLRLTSTENGQETITGPGGPYPIRSVPQAGWVSSGLREEGGVVYLAGWAVDAKTQRLPTSVLIFRNGSLFVSAATRFERPEVTRLFDNPSLLDSGFVVEFPQETFPNPSQEDIRLFALSEAGTASELNYPQGSHSRWLFAPSGSSREPPDYPWDTTLRFGREGNSRPYRLWGWSEQETGISWTLSDGATLALRVTPPKGPVRLKIQLNPFLGDGAWERQRVRVLLNQQPAGEWVLTQPGFQEKSLLIDEEFFRHPERLLLTLETPDSISPSALGTSRDKRELGLAVHSLQLSPVAAGPPHQAAPQ